MEQSDVEQVVGALREQVAAVEGVYAGQQARREEAWERELPNLKLFIQALAETRGLVAGEVKRVHEHLTSLKSTAKIGAVNAGFNVIQARAGPDGAPLSVVDLTTERDRLKGALERLDNDIIVARRELRKLQRPEEQEIYEAKLMILQDTRRMHQEEVDLCEVELLGRQRSERQAAERRAAEQSGWADLARLRDSLTQADLRVDLSKKRLYFPDVKGYGMAFGSNGIYIGGKDTFVSELTGNWSIVGEAGPSANKATGGQVGRIIVTLGSAASANPPAPQRSGVSYTGTAKKSFSMKERSTPPSPLQGPPSLARTSAPGGPDQAQHQQPASRSATPPKSSPRRRVAFSEDADAALPKVGSAGSVAALAERFGPVVKAVKPPSPEGNKLRSASASDADLKQPPDEAEAPAAAVNGVTGRAPPLKHGSEPISSSGSSPSQPPAQPAPGQAAAALGAGAGGAGVVYGLPPRPIFGSRDPHKSKPKAMAMKFINKIGGKEMFTTKKGKDKRDFSYQGDWSRHGGSEEGKGGSLASRLLSKKFERAPEKLSFGSNAQGLQRHQRSASSDSATLPAPAPAPSLTPSALDRQPAGLFQPAAAVPPAAPEPTPAQQPSSSDGDFGERQHSRRQSMEEMEATQGTRAGSEGEPGDRGDEGSQAGDDTASWAEAPDADDPTVLPPTSHATTHSTGSDSWDAVSSWQGSDGPGSAAAAGRAGVFVVLRLEDVSLVGERGTKIPNATIRQLNLELEFKMQLTFEFNSQLGWHAPHKPKFEILFLDRSIKGNSVPLPRTLVRFLLGATLPRIFQRRIMRLLAPELGQYLLDAGRGVSLAGELGLVGPALSALDASLAYQAPPPATLAAWSSKDAKRAAAHAAAAQEARSMLGLSLEQAGVLAELFGGRLNLAGAAGSGGATICSLITFYKHRCANADLWQQLCAVWDAALRLVCRSRGVTPLAFKEFMERGVAALARKPVRARLLVHKADAAINVDVALEAARDGFERTAREWHAKAQAGSAPQQQDSSGVQALQSLEVQLEALAAWETYMVSRLKTFKGRFKCAAATVVGGADAGTFSIGAERAQYEGPLQLRANVNTRGVDADGGFTFEIPLPSPRGPIRIFLDRIRTVLSMPLPPYFAPALEMLSGSGNLDEAAGTAAPAAAQNGDALMDSQASSNGEGRSVLDTLRDLHDTHFGADGSAASTSGTSDAPPGPAKLGKVIVNRMRVRFRLNERRLAEMLTGISPETMGAAFLSTTSGLLSCLGDIASLSFAPAYNEEGGAAVYQLCLQSSDVSNVCADLESLGFKSAISPARMIRVLHTIVRTVALSFQAADPKRVQAIDHLFHNLYKYVVREALDVSFCLQGRSKVQEHPRLPAHTELFVFLSGLADDGEAWPVNFTNDIDLLTLYQSMISDPDL